MQLVRRCSFSKQSLGTERGSKTDLEKQKEVAEWRVSSKRRTGGKRTIDGMRDGRVEYDISPLCGEAQPCVSPVFAYEITRARQNVAWVLLSLLFATADEVERRRRGSTRFLDDGSARGECSLRI